MQHQFQFAFLHPRYWPLWSGLLFLWLLVRLPYAVLCIIGPHLGTLSRCFLRRRAAIAERNIALCFPHYTQEERERLVAENFRSAGMALIETGMAWFWPDRRLRKWFDTEGLEHLTSALNSRRGVMLLGVHFMSVELGGRITGLCHPVMATYRPHNNPLMEWVQTRGRLRSNRAMISRKNLHGMVRALKQGEAVWFAPDHDYGARGSCFAPFFAVQDAATTNGTLVLSRLSGAAMLSVSMTRKPGGEGYRLHVSPEIQWPSDVPHEAAAFINRLTEREIMRAPGQYLWMHRRFKTRPQGQPSLY
ncbi:KDO2-lipid IV(A) palmitoleoyltransferase [Pantoea sesami]|nr:KDO2-lipid IV(A) palmitoleoyltransferase [Pantoea sesami]